MMLPNAASRHEKAVLHFHHREKITAAAKISRSAVAQTCQGVRNNAALHPDASFIAPAVANTAPIRSA
jgi:hypothetical protein